MRAGPMIDARSRCVARRTSSSRAARLRICLALLPVVFGVPAVSQAQSTPKTISQCKQAFKRSRSRRAACIKRVESDKPGSSCAHPLESGMATDGAAIGDTKDFTVTAKQINDENSVHPEPRVEEVEVTIRNPRVLICSVKVYETTTNPSTHARETHIYQPTISPHGGLSSPVIEPLTILYFSVQVYARLA